MKPRGKALVIGDDTRSFLATVRSLGRQGIEVHAAPFNLNAPALSSRYIQKTHLLPYYLDGGASWLSAIKSLMETERFDIVIPCEERSLLPLCRHQHELAGSCVLAIPNERALEVFFDKAITRELATRLGVPVAKGKMLLESDTVSTILESLNLPVIAKQSRSYAWPELYVRSSVKLIETREKLANYLQENKGERRDIFFEQIFPGRGLGVSVLCHEGRVLQVFEHHRVHELHGSSYYRKSAPVDAGRLGAVCAMVADVGYTGMAMFEFKMNELSGEWILLEVNARPWGSLPLPVALGVDFPYFMYRLLVLEDAVKQVSYAPNIYGRNLLAELWQLRAGLHELAASRRKQLALLIQWIGEFRHLLVFREHFDTLVLDDFKPGLVEIAQLFGDRLNGWKASFGSTQNANVMSLSQRLKAVWQLGGEPAHLVFVCQGNICRSPYAELKAKQLFAAQANRVTFSSAGMLPRNRRPSPEVAIAAAAQQNVDLSLHQSQHAHESLMQDATAIVVFDNLNLHYVLNRYPAMKDKIYLIGEFLENRKPIAEVVDPEGQQLADFLATYRLIDQCLVGFGALLNITTRSNQG